MFVIGGKNKYLVLAIVFAFLGGVTEKVEAVCDIENVCELVEKEKKEKEATLDQKEAILDKDTIKEIKRKCENKDPVGSTCPMKQVIKLCWDKKSAAAVVNQCKED